MDPDMRPEELELTRAWIKCLGAGTRAVRFPSLRKESRGLGLPKITIFHIPSFEDCHGWTVYYKQREDSRYLLQDLIWRQSSDIERMEDARHRALKGISSEPTLEVRTAYLAAAWFWEQWRSLSQISIPIVVEPQYGLDGESYGINITYRLQLEWLNEPPSAWRELGTWVHNCIEVFRNHL